MKVRDIEQIFAAMHGERLLEELVTYAASFYDQNLKGKDASVDARRKAIIRAIQTRLAETGIARRHHGEACRFMLGDDRCRCSLGGWSWPRRGLKDPSIGGGL